MKKITVLQHFGLLDEKYVEEASPEKARRITSFHKVTALRWASIAACLCVLALLSVNVLLPLFNGFSSRIPSYKDADYSAADIGKIFGNTESSETSSYEKIYVPSSEFLNISPFSLPEQIEIYESQSFKKEIDKSQLSQFTDPIFSRFASEINAAVPSYEIKEEASSSGIDSLRISVREFGDYTVRVSQMKTHYSVSFTSYNGPLSIGGVNIEVDQTKTDSEIVTSLAEIKEKLFYVLGVEFSDVKITRRYGGYSKHGVEQLYVFLYNEDDHPLNAYADFPLSDYIWLTFSNSENSEGKVASDGILSDVDVFYRQHRYNVGDSYTLAKKVRTISIAEAEQLLYNGYVFGGHSCPLCMAAQEKVDFEGYDYVSLTYMFGYNEASKKSESIPFYVFYKNIGVAQNGNKIYARTYVPAIQVSGYKEYFESQKKNHRSDDSIE